MGWLQLILIPLLYYLGAKLSLAFAVMPEVLVMLWIPNSILLAGLLHFRGRRYPLFAALVIAAELAADYQTFTWLEAALFGAINMLEVTIAYLLLTRWKFDPRFVAPIDIAKFVFSGPVIAAFTSACCAATTYRLLRGADFSDVLGVWWLSDGLGLLILTPLVLSLWPPLPPLREPRVRFRWYDAVAVTVAIPIVVPFALAHQRLFHGVMVRPFMLLPPALYAAARFSMRTTTISVALLSALTLFVTKNGQQPFGDVAAHETVLSAQELIFIMSTTSLGIAALLSQYRRYALQLESRVKERTAELELIAITDSLTGILNRRALFDLLPREIDRDKRYGHTLALITFDIDHFKSVNDLHGHATGDVVLREVASVARTVIRSSDFIARYGGEEFVVVAPEIGKDAALQLAERLRLAIRAQECDGIHVTASFGVALLHPNDDTPDQLLRRADQALYAAKSAGRDRVCFGDYPEGRRLA